MGRRRAGRQRAERLGFRLLLALVRPLPYGASAVLARWLGRFAFDVVRLRRDLAVRNVEERIAPAGGHAEAVRIARESYAVMSQTFLDLVRVDRIRDEELWNVLRREEFDAFLRESEEPGGVLVSGHFGNWELLVLALRRVGLPVSAMVGDQSNAFVDEEVKRIRSAAGIDTLSARSGLKPALEKLRRGEFLATLMDQDARRKGVFVEFLGTPAACHTGVVSMALRTGKRLVPGVLVNRGGTYRFVLGERWFPDPERTEQENLVAGTEHFHRFLEEQVRAHPGNYLWAHRRWKTRPPEEASRPSGSVA